MPLARGLKSDEIVVAGVVLGLLVELARGAICDALLLPATVTGDWKDIIGGRSARRRSRSASYWIPLAARISFRISFSSRIECIISLCC